MAFVCFSLAPHFPLLPQLLLLERSYHLSGMKVGEGWVAAGVMGSRNEVAVSTMRDGAEARSPSQDSKGL